MSKNRHNKDKKLHNSEESLHNSSLRLPVLLLHQTEAMQFLQLNNRAGEIIPTPFTGLETRCEMIATSVTPSPQIL